MNNHFSQETSSGLLRRINTDNYIISIYSKPNCFNVDVVDDVFNMWSIMIKNGSKQYTTISKCVLYTGDRLPIISLFEDGTISIDINIADVYPLTNNVLNTPLVCDNYINVIPDNVSKTIDTSVYSYDIILKNTMDDLRDANEYANNFTPLEIFLSPNKNPPDSIFYVQQLYSQLTDKSLKQNNNNIWEWGWRW